jgi:hypothetical protein
MFFLAIVELVQLIAFYGKRRVSDDKVHHRIREVSFRTCDAIHIVVRVPHQSEICTYSIYIPHDIIILITINIIKRLFLQPGSNETQAYQITERKYEYFIQDEIANQYK